MTKVRGFNEKSRPRFYQHEGFTITPEGVGRQLHRAMAKLLCTHKALDACPECYTAAARQIKPVARALLHAGMTGRPDQATGNVFVGEAIEVLFKQAGL